MKIITYISPIGELHIACRDDVVVAISDNEFDDAYLDKLLKQPSVGLSGRQNMPVEKWLDEYFSGKIPAQYVKMELHGTIFQQQVWLACAKIPYGETRSYGELAAMIGNPKAMRAVGSALGRNPVPILLPCHRVLQSGGKLGGFGWGLNVKQKLLNLEKM
jgi:methylated-DNA-[protein]-cysteine S-methyltransferase